MSSTSYEIWRERKPNVKYFHIFGSTYFVLADREPRNKLDAKSDETIFLGYTTSGTAFRVFNKRTQCIIESRNMVVDDEDSVSEEDEPSASPDVHYGVTEDVLRHW